MKGPNQKDNNKNMKNEKCEGCRSLYEPTQCCCFTKIGVPYISNCPCFDCIVKPICTTCCEKLVETVNNSKDKLKRINLYHYKNRTFSTIKEKIST